MKSARQTAFEILTKINRDASFSNLAVDSALSECNFSENDRGFVSALVYGVLERTFTVDYQLSLYLKQPVRKLKPQVRVLLQMGVYQLLFMDKIPDSAAVNETVSLAKSNGCSFAAGMINAVLRNVSKNGMRLPDENDKLLCYSVKYSFPVELIKFWIKSYGEENAVGIMSECDGRPPLSIRVNTLKSNTDELSSLLQKDDIYVEKGTAEDSLNLGKCGSIEKTQAFKNGCFHVQDIASQLCAKALNPQENETVLDLCAAPGGKSFTLAQLMKNTGRIIACDIHNHRLALIKSGAERLGITNIECVRNDASLFNDNIPSADRVLCDVPCSGLGIIRRKPEIRLKPLEQLKELPPLQLKILTNASRYVKKGGRLVYSTCALNPKENEGVCKKFLENNRDFKVITPDLFTVNTFIRDGFITLMPHINGTDGFFIAVFERK